MEPQVPLPRRAVKEPDDPTEPFSLNYGRDPLIYPTAAILGSTEPGQWRTVVFQRAD